MQFPNMLFLWICYNQMVNYFWFYPNISKTFWSFPKQEYFITKIIDVMKLALTLI